MADVANLDDLALAISSKSPNIKTYAKAQAAATQSQENDLQQLQADDVDPREHGVKQDGLTDDWQAWQQLLLTSAGQRIEGAGVAFGNTSVLSQPLAIPTERHLSHVTFQTRQGFGPIDPGGAMLMLANRFSTFTADAASNVFTAPTVVVGGYDVTARSRVMLNAPYGETLPAPLVSGKVYYVRSASTGKTFTISETPGGPEFELIADGSGYAYYAVYDLARTYWEYVRINLTVPNVNGAMLNLQQPAAVSNLRIEMDAPGAAPYPAATGLRLGGQIGYVENVECNTEANCRGIMVEGLGMVVNNFNDNGKGVAIEVNGHAVSLSNLWTEGLDVAGVLVSGECRGLNISGSWLHTGSGPALKVMNGMTTYEVGQIYVGNSNRALITDTIRGYTLGSFGWSSDPHSVATDYHYVFPGWTQLGYTGGDEPAPTFKTRFQQKMTANKSPFRMRFIDEYMRVDTTDGPCTVSLGKGSGWRGHSYRIHHYAGANECTVDTTGAETIDGAASVVVPLGKIATFTSDGVNYGTGAIT